MVEQYSFRIAGFAKRHNISPATVWKEIAAGRLTATYLGGPRNPRITLDEERRWLAAQETRCGRERTPAKAAAQDSEA